MTYDPKQLIFTDCETTGLDTRQHDVWNIAWIVWDEENRVWEETERRVWPPALQNAQPDALRINQFYNRTTPIRSESVVTWDDPSYVAQELAYITAGKHLVGACPWFDAAFYEKFLRSFGYCPAWHYHLIDIEALSIGYLAGFADKEHEEYFDLPLPWKSDWVAGELGIQRPPKDQRHTALGDTREVLKAFIYLMGEPVIEEPDIKDPSDSLVLNITPPRIVKDAPL